MDISSIERCFPNVKESHKINILAMKISNDFDWWSDLLNDDWLSCENLSAFIGQFDDMLPLAWELSTWFDFLTFLWLQERLQEHLTK
jgi:hypothetical protein